MANGLCDNQVNHLQMFVTMFALNMAYNIVYCLGYLRSYAVPSSGETVDTDARHGLNNLQNKWI